MASLSVLGLIDENAVLTLYPIPEYQEGDNGDDPPPTEPMTQKFADFSLKETLDLKFSSVCCYLNWDFSMINPLQIN